MPIGVARLLNENHIVLKKRTIYYPNIRIIDSIDNILAILLCVVRIINR